METMTKTPTMNAVDYFRTKLAYETTPHELAAAKENGSVYVLDVRDPESFKKEHIAGAVNIPLTELVQHLADIPRDKTVVTYCWNITCAMATKAALQLAEKGFTVQELVGGISEWKTKQFPTERATSRTTTTGKTTKKPVRHHR